jgi:hypothetical protein
MLRSEVPDIPADVDEFVDQLAVDDWLEVVDTGKVTASDSVPPTG